MLEDGGGGVEEDGGGGVDEDGGGGVLEDGGGGVLDDGGVLLVRPPKKSIEYCTMPLNGSVWPCPATLMPSTGACVTLEPYRVRVHPDCGLLEATGLWLTPLRLVHCLISSPKLL